jgi:hypothetical protein
MRQGIFNLTQLTYSQNCFAIVRYSHILHLPCMVASAYGIAFHD